ncbi:hypothetical protein DVH24_002275 [Malus domestica]|uniref:Uncharacterized protein n=1 Tax=Malus domestica TaxID=3750 RepID=A0A498I9T6_MALDO|nr:hypothetical protein DVH24_002275 [Malus domestica]
MAKSVAQNENDDDEIDDIQQQEEDDDERTVSNVPEKGGRGGENENDDNFDTLVDSQSIFSTQILNEQVQDDQDIAHDSAHPTIESEERNLAVQKVALSTSIEESIPLKVAPSTTIQESCPQILVQHQEQAKTNVELVPQIPGQEANAESVPLLPVQTKEQQVHVASVPQLPVHPEKPAIKTRKQQTFYEWLLAPLTSEDKWEFENSEEELIQEELLQSQTDHAEY